MTTFATMDVLFQTILHSLSNAAEAEPNLPAGAIPSHIRIRSKTPEQFEFFRAHATNRTYFDFSKTEQHKGRDVIFCCLSAKFYRFKTPTMQDYRIRWLEFTAPRPEHEDGPDALVFETPGITEPREEKVSPHSTFLLRFQSLSAQDIVYN